MHGTALTQRALQTKVNALKEFNSRLFLDWNASISSMAHKIGLEV